MQDIIHYFLKLGIGPVVFAILWSVISTAVVSIIFWGVRRYWLETAAFGTELFAMLFAVDLAVVLGLVQVWRLSGCADGPVWWCEDLAMAEWLYRVVAGAFLILNPYLAIVSVQYERRSLALRRARSAGVMSRTLDLWWVWATMLRWILSSAHVFWIIKAPKWALFL